VIGADALFNSRGEQLAALAVRHAVPAIYQFPLGVYTGRILKGEKPAELAVQQATKLELIINMKTAKTLGIPVPLPLIGRADEVIE